MTAGFYTEYRFRTKTARRVLTLVCPLSLPMLAQIPDTTNLPLRSLHTHDGELFIRLPGAVMPPKVFNIGNGVSPPKVIFSPDPEYSEEARQAKYQGTVVLGMVVDSDGHPYRIRILRSVGYGLDEKAIEAVKRWRFNPAMKDNIPVAVFVSVEVDFRL